MGYGYEDSRVRRIVATVASGSTDAVLLPAESGVKFRLLSLTAVAPVATPLTLNTKGSGAGTPVSPALPGSSGGPCPAWGHNPQGWLETLPGEALTATTGAGGALAVHGVAVTVQADDTYLLADESGGLLLLEDGLTPITT